MDLDSEKKNVEHSRLMGKTAVALKYDLEKDAAPRIVATGKGYVAEKIIDTAKEANVPVHRDDAVARTLSKLELGDTIPPELYEVVAQILIYVDRVDARKLK